MVPRGGRAALNQENHSSLGTDARQSPNSGGIWGLLGALWGSVALEAAALKLLRGLAAKRFHTVPERKGPFCAPKGLLLCVFTAVTPPKLLCVHPKCCCNPQQQGAPESFANTTADARAKKRKTNLKTHVKVIYFFFFFLTFSLPHLRFPKFCTTDHQVRESQPFAEFPSYKAKKRGKKGGKEGWVGEITKKGKRRAQGMGTNPSGNCTWEHGQSGCTPLQQRDCAGPQGPSLEY